MEPYAESYRTSPKSWYLGADALRFDGEGRLWAATTRDRDRFSYFDVWAGTEHLGMVRIHDRIIGYDLYGETLAVLVERRPAPDGAAPRAIDWYDIGGLEFGGADPRR